MALTKVSRGLISTSIVDNGNATAITIDSSENVSFTGAGTFSGDVGIGVTPKAAGGTYTGLEVGTATLLGAAATDELYMCGNAYYDGAWKRKAAYTASRIVLSDNLTIFQTAVTGAADSAITWAESARIDASGNLLVGKTATGLGNQGAELSATGQLKGTAADQVVAYLNRTGSDGTIAEFRKDNTTVGSIGVDYSTEFYMGGGGGGFYINSASIRPTTGGNSNTLSDNTHDFGSGSHRFKDLYLSGGVYLGGTGAANKLDDYEEGTWAPNIIRNGGSIAATFTAFNSTYVKIGNIVYVKTYIHTMSNGSSNGTSYWRINGMPFAGSVESYTGIALGYNSSPADNCYVGDAGGNAILCIGATPYTGAISGGFMLSFTYRVN